MPTAHYKRVGSGDSMRYELDYYTVSNTQQLSGIRNLLAPEVPIYLTRDLWLNPDTNPTEKAFTPIGGGNKAFVGTFDGQGHTIYNLYISYSSIFVYLSEIFAFQPDSPAVNHNLSRKEIQ